MISFLLVTECRLSLQHVLREHRMWKLSDASSRCHLSAKYFRHMTEIYKKVMDHPVHTEPETPNIVYPNRYLPDINVLTCKPRLVIKNWSHAVGTIPVNKQDPLRKQLEGIFAKYARLANIEESQSQVDSNCTNNGFLTITNVTGSENFDETDS